MNKRKRVSVAKVAIDILLLAGLMTSIGVIAEDVKHPKKEVEAAATVRETKTDSTPVKEYAVPYGNTSFKSYMGYKSITNTASAQYKFQQKCWTDDEGLRRQEDDYVVALGSYYADDIGDRFEITLTTGQVFTAVVGDFKSDLHTDSTHKYTPMNNGNKNVIEFIVDTKLLNSTARKMGDISYIEGFEGDVESIKRCME